MAVTVAFDDQVCRVVLDRPEKLNALNAEVRSRLREVLDRLEDDPSVRVLVVSGAGRAFSAGVDLVEGPRLPEGWAERRHEAGAWHRVLDRLERIPQVTVAAVHGPVVGGGLLLAAACDLRVAADDARFSIPELAVGIPLTWGGLPRLVAEIGLPRTRDLVMTGRTVGAPEALEWGLVQRVVPADGLGGEVDALVGSLLDAPAAPLAMTRAALRALGPGGAGSAWADADVLAAALERPESGDAARRYLSEHVRRRSGPEQ